MLQFLKIIKTALQHITKKIYVVGVYKDKTSNSPFHTAICAQFSNGVAFFASTFSRIDSRFIESKTDRLTCYYDVQTALNIDEEAYSEILIQSIQSDHDRPYRYVCDKYGYKIIGYELDRYFQKFSFESIGSINSDFIFIIIIKQKSSRAGSEDGKASSGRSHR